MIPHNNYAKIMQHHINIYHPKGNASCACNVDKVRDLLKDVFIGYLSECVAYSSPFLVGFFAFASLT